MPFGATSYSHFAGSGRRDWLIEVSTTCNITNGPISNLVDGVKANNNADGVFCNSAESGREFKFKWPWPVRIDEFTWTQDAAGSQGTWKIAGSNDDSTYTDLATGINLGGAAAADVHAFTNPNGYQYYKLIQTAGSTTNSRWIQEVEFKVALDSNYGGVATGSTSYANLDGSGDRSARMLMLLDVATACGGSDVGNMNAMLNGVTGVQNCTDATAFNASSGRTIKICFRNPLAINAFTWKQQVVAAHGTWKIAGSFDDVTYTDLATGLALGAGSTSEEFTFTNDTGYNFYKLIQTAGSTNTAAWLYEIEFKTSLVAPSYHYRVAADAIEVLNAGAGSHAQVAASAIEVMNASDGSAAQVAASAIMVLSSVALKPERTFDGSKIYEFEFAFQPENRYNEADWDSIYSIGPRVANGTLTFIQDGWPAVFGAGVHQLADYNWGLSGGNGFAVGGSSTTPAGAYVGWETADGSFQFISGFKVFGISGWHGNYIMFGGYDRQVWAVNTLNFDEFAVGGFGGDGSATFEFDTPFFPFNYWSFTLAGLAEGAEDPGFAGNDFGPEFMFKVYHSVLDGGDRRPTNGRAIKRVGVAVSSGIDPKPIASGSFDPLLNLIDGRYSGSNGGPVPPTGKSDITLLQRVGGSPGDAAINAAGEYIQFSFPRKVFMRETVWNVGDAEVLSGGEPTRFGKWQWYASNAAGSGYLPVGDPWHFAPGSAWIKSPKPLPDSAYNATSIYPYWRMVLVEGPAFGDATETRIYQVQFNLIDPDDQSPLFEVAFTDDSSDQLLGSLIISQPGSAFEAAFTDYDDDRLTADISITTNFILTAAFTDGDSDALSAFGSFYPAVFTQTVVNVKGK